MSGRAGRRVETGVGRKGGAGGWEGGAGRGEGGRGGGGAGVKGGRARASVGSEWGEEGYRSRWDQITLKQNI